jgi:SulP family sulfate permease
MSFLYRTSKPAMRTMGFDSRGLDRQFVVIDNSPDAGLVPAQKAGP